MIKSPLTGKTAKLEENIASSDIIKEYLSQFEYDVSQLFSGINQIGVYKCIDTGYRFYFPFNITGDSAFYEHLQDFDWYYKPWKWEHENAIKFIKQNMNVLEIGCGTGDFLLKAKERLNAQCVGIELNKNAITIANQKGVTVYNESIEQHSLANKDVYDVVCSFQVMEHISNVYSFIQSQISCLKKGGSLIISVPNNDSWLKRSYNILNMPPHHMGLWNKKSLCSLDKHFNLKVIKVSFEPLQIYHNEYYYQTHEYLFEKIKIIPKRLWKYLIPIIYYVSSKSYNGYTIQVVYSKK